MWPLSVNGWARGLAFIQVDQRMVALAESVGTGSGNVGLGIAGKFKKHDEWALWATRYHGERPSAFDWAGIRESQPRNISKD